MMTETLHFKELGEFGVVDCGRKKGYRGRDVPKRVAALSVFILLVCAFSRTSWMEVL